MVGPSQNVKPMQSTAPPSKGSIASGNAPRRTGEGRNQGRSQTTRGRVYTMGI